MKCLKSIVLSTVAASTLFGTTVTVPTTGWNLMGAMNTINPYSAFNQANVKSVWAWDATNKKWIAYAPSTSSDFNGIGTLATNNQISMFNMQSTISSGSGFWINTTGNVSYDSDTNTTTPTPVTFTAYGLNFAQKISSALPGITYTASGSSVSFSNNIIHLVANQASGLESRSEAQVQVNGAKGATAQMKLLASTNTYNKMQLRTQSSVTIPDSLKTSLDLNSNNVLAHCMIIVSANEMRAKVILDDGTTTLPTVFNQVMSTDSFLNKQVNLSLQSTSDGSGMVFSATADNATITSKTFIRPTGVVSTSGISAVKVRTQIDNNSQATPTASADVYGVQVSYPSVSDLNITSEATSSQLSFDNFTTGVDMETSDSQWFGHFSLTGTTMTITDYDYRNNGWEIEDGNHSGTLTKDTTNSKIATFTEADGFQGKITLGTTQRITSINGATYSNLYATPMSFEVLASGTGWTDTWDWAPTYWDGSTSVNVTTNTQLLNMFITNNHWFDSENHAMLAGTVGATSGNVVKGVWDGTSYHTGCTSDDCRVWTKGTEVIGSWTFNATTGVTIDLPEQTETISLQADSSSPTGYYVQSVGQDKVGTVWEETMFTGSDATIANFQNILQP